MLRSLSIKAFIACSSVLCLSSLSMATDAEPALNTATKPNNLQMSIDELSKYNGLNGQKAYVVVDSVIYDVTNVKAWKNGQHNGNKAGQDLTAVIQKAPHSKKVLAKLTKVGKLTPSAVSKASDPSSIKAASSIDTSKKAVTTAAAPVDTSIKAVTTAAAPVDTSKKAVKAAAAPIDTSKKAVKAAATPIDTSKKTVLPVKVK